MNIIVQTKNNNYFFILENPMCLFKNENKKIPLSTITLFYPFKSVITNNKHLEVKL